MSFHFESRLRNLADLNEFVDSSICRTMIQRSFIAPAAQLVKNNVHDHVQFGVIQPHLQETVRASYDHRKLKQVEILSPPEKSPSPLSSSENDNEKSPSEQRSGGSSRFKLEVLSRSLSQIEYLTTPSSERFRCSILVLFHGNERFH